MPVPSAAGHRLHLRAAGRWGAAFLALCLLAQGAWAQEPQEPRWIPSINFGFETFAYDADATGENHINPPAWEGIQTTQSLNQLRFQFGAELMSPMLPLPGRPRFFVQGGAQLGTVSADRLFGTGNLNGDPEQDILQFVALRTRDIRFGCRDEDPPTCITAVAGEFEGQGSRIEAKIEDPSWNASLGVAFDIPVSESVLFQVKPSATYNMEKAKLSGQTTTVEETDTNPLRQVFQVRRGIASESATHHSVGCGLELGLFLFRSVRPVTTSLYLNTRFLWALGDTATTFSDPGGVATFTVDRESYEFRGGAGVRFSWMGFSGR